MPNNACIASGTYFGIRSLYRSLQIVSNELWGGFLVIAWSGKIYSILITLMLLYALRSVISPGEAGISLRANKGSLLPSAGILLGIAAWSTFTGSLAPEDRSAWRRSPTWRSCRD